MSDLQQVDWASFRVANEGQYGGGSELEHHRGRCNWSPCIDDLNPLEISKLAAEHAEVCAGERVPPRRAPASEYAMNPTAQKVWGKLVLTSLHNVMVLTSQVSAPGTDADGD